MKCKQAKASIALWVGNDLEEENIPELERHVTVCPCCRFFWKQIQQTQQVLQQVDCKPFSATHGDDQSIWQDLSTKIDRNTEHFQRERFNGWLPALAVVSACLLLLLYSQSLFQTVSSVPYLSVAEDPAIDVLNGSAEALFQQSFQPSIFQPEGAIPADWSNSSPLRSNYNNDNYLAPFPFETYQSPATQNLIQSVELPSVDH